jgi:hypothetical protein
MCLPNKSLSDKIGFSMGQLIAKSESFQKIQSSDALL